MRRGFFSRMNPTLRGFLIILAIVTVIVVLQLQATLVALLLIARIVFILAIAFFIYLIWRERREEISAWPLRARIVFYGAAALAIADLGAQLVRRRARSAGARVHRRAGSLRVRDVARLARPAHV